MTACLIVLGLLVHCGSTSRAPVAGPPPGPVARPVAAAAAADRWVAEDKLQHFAASFAATSMTYGGARSLLDRRAARVAAGSVALALGVAKEIADARRGGPFSLKDMAWDAAGVALGLALARSVR
jgi:uncharacterized protein YfiM (DUF2279 family)